MVNLFTDEVNISTSIQTLRTQENSISSVPQVYVVLAADFDSPESVANYGILAPLTTFIWNRVFNVTPIVILSTQEPGRLTTATEAAFARLVHRAGGRVHCISKSTSKVEGSGVSLDPELVGAALITALQVSRIASIALEYINDEDVIFTSDADVWPMSTVFWNDYLSNSLLTGNENFLVYDKRFYHEQKEKKDCNFLAVTIGFGTKKRVWRDILSKWLHSRNYAPSPRAPFCIYPNNSNSNPMLPWYNNTEKSQYIHFLKSDLNRNGLGISFPDLLRVFLEEGKYVYGPVWRKEIWLSAGGYYKQRLIWSFDQVLVAEMILSSNTHLQVNDDLRRLDKFGTRYSEYDFSATINGKSVQDFTDAHIDGVDHLNLWRLESIWLFLFHGKSQEKFLSEALEFFLLVRTFYDAISSNIDEETRDNILFSEISN